MRLMNHTPENKNKALNLKCFCFQIQTERTYAEQSTNTNMKSKKKRTAHIHMHKRPIRMYASHSLDAYAQVENSQLAIFASSVAFLRFTLLIWSISTFNWTYSGVYSWRLFLRCECVWSKWFFFFSQFYLTYSNSWSFPHISSYVSFNRNRVDYF